MTDKTSFIVETINGEDTYYRKNGLFKKEKCDLKTFYTGQGEKYREESKYRILPLINETTRYDSISFLYNKSILSRQNNWPSDLGRRVKVNCKYHEDSFYEKYKKEEVTFGSRINYEVTLLEEDGTPIFNDYFIFPVYFTEKYYDAFNYSPEYIGLLIRNSINGNLQTFRDICETMMKYNEDIYYEPMEILKCDVCGKKFFNPIEYLAHLIEEGHEDSFLDDFPNDNEIIHVKKCIQKTKEKLNQV